jgi:hypothetical protein
VSPIGSEEITFGRFRLHPGRREPLRDEVPVRLHRRAFDILCALAAAKGAIVGKDELLALLWPGRIVEEGNLHVHVSGLRRAFDEHGEGYSYIVTFRVAAIDWRDLPSQCRQIPRRLLCHDRCHCPKSRRSRFCRSTICQRRPKRRLPKLTRDMLACSGSRRPRSAPLETVDAAGCPDDGCCGADRA